ncbi:MAG: Lrp/AsnC family transcriptional regulator [Granulosicoccus sp.]|nr:Lrp/AsnC family transcriptional regulator [Granulosicoccus sp.]
MSELDRHDRRILRALQENGRLGNNELAELVGLSASQCSRRRTALEQSGCISGYHAHLDRSKIEQSLISYISVTLHAHTTDNAQLFKSLVADLPMVMEVHALTGEMDYLLKVVCADLQSLNELINNVMLPHASVGHVKTAIVLETFKETSSIPV